MKKILLMLVVSFGAYGVAIAQDPTVAKKKKSTAVVYSSPQEEVAAKLKRKAAKKPASVTFSKAEATQSKKAN